MRIKIWQTVAMAALLIFSVTLSGCNKEVGPLTMPPGIAPQNGQKADKLVMDIYWDATVSMEGFTKLAAGNIYRSLPDILGDMGSALGEAHFFRFGKQVTPVEGRDYRRFSSPECYTELETYFGNVLEEADPEHLSIVVTDLFESEADWSNVTHKLREKYFSKHFSIAVIGIKNSFSGKIYDVGLNAATFDYDSGDDPARFRPFYLFIMGPEQQLRFFLDEWERKQLAAKEMNYVVLSEYLAAQMATLNVAMATKTENMYTDGQLLKEDDRLQEVGVGDRNKKVELTIPGNFQPYKHTCLEAKDLTSPRVKIFAWNEPVQESSLIFKMKKMFSSSDDEDKEEVDEKEDEEEKQEGGWQELEDRWVHQESRDAKAICDWVADDKGNNFTLTLNFLPSGTLPLGKVALVQVQLVPARQDLVLPKWVIDWDMGDIDSQPERFDGAKTVNLRRIVDSLKDSLLATTQPTVIELYLVIDGR